MWIRKVQRDQNKGVDSPMPTQVVSNEEFIPRPQNPRQKQLEKLIGDMASANAKKIGMDRRAFMASSMGLATCFLASNKIYGKTFDVDEADGNLRRGRLLCEHNRCEARKHNADQHACQHTPPASAQSPLAPAQAGTQSKRRFWIPAFAGMSGG